MVAQNWGSVVLFWVPTLKEAVPPAPPGVGWGPELNLHHRGIRTREGVAATYHMAEHMETGYSIIKWTPVYCLQIL